MICTNQKIKNSVKKIQKKLFFLALLTFLALKLNAGYLTNSLNNFKKKFKQQEEVIDDQAQTIFSKQNQLGIEIQDTDTYVLVNIFGITGENFNATVNDQKNEIMITTPTDTLIVIDFERKNNGQNYVSINAEQKINSEQKKEEQEGNQKGKVISTQMYSSASRASYERMLNGLIDIDSMMEKRDQMINFDRDNQILSITLPKVINKPKQEKKEKGTNIPVTVFSAKPSIAPEKQISDDIETQKNSKN